MQRQTRVLLVVLMLLIGTGARLGRLNTPSVMFFDEFVSGRHAEATLFRQKEHDGRSRLSFPHPPLAFLSMTSAMRWLHQVSQQQVALPFPPNSMVYLAFTDSVYFLSPDGTRLLAVSCKDPTRHRLMTLKVRLRRLSASSYGTLYALSHRERKLVWLDEEGRVLRTLPLPFLPDKVSAADLHGQRLCVLISHFHTGQIALIESHNGEVLWTMDLKTTLSDVAFDVIHGLIYLTLPKQKRILAVDLTGQEVRHWHLGLTPSSVIPVAVPSLIPPNRYKGRGFLYAFSASRRGALCFDPSGTFASVHLNFTTPVTSIAWHPKVPYIYAASGRMVYAINGATFQIAYTFAAPWQATDLLLMPDNLFLAGTSRTRPKAIFWHLPNHAFALRLPSALLGGLGLPLLGFVLVNRATQRVYVALLIALFVSVDPLLFFLSRIALLDIYVACAVVAAYWCCYRYLTATPGRERMISAGLMGVCLGLGIASKWSAAPAIGGTLMLVALAHLGAFQNCRRDETRVRRLSLTIVAVLLITAVAYFATYAIYWARGHSVWDILKWQWRMFHFHASWHHPHELASRWWQWIFGMKPGLLWHEDMGAQAQWIYLCGASWLWLPGLFCGATTATRAWRTRELFPTLIVVAFAFAWLPWMFSPRTAFLYHFSTALPFLYMAVAYVIGNIRSGAWQMSTRWREYTLLLCDGYVVLAVLTLIWLYPTLTGYPLPSPTGHHYSAWWMGWLPVLTPH